MLNTDHVLSCTTKTSATASLAHIKTQFTQQANNLEDLQLKQLRDDAVLVDLKNQLNESVMADVNMLSEQLNNIAVSRKERFPRL